MSNSGGDQPLVPRRSLRPAQSSVNAPTPPMGIPAASTGAAAGSSGSAAGRTTARPAAPQPATRQAPAAGPSTYREPDDRQRSTVIQQPAVPTASPVPSRGKAVRRARLRLIRIDPWSVTKTAFLLSIAFGVMCVVAVALVMSLMSAAGLWDHVNQSIQGVLNQDPADAFNIKDYVSTNRVLGLTMLIAALDVVLMTALATLGAFLYNMAASLLGGVELTLAEEPQR